MTSRLLSRMTGVLLGLTAVMAASGPAVGADTFEIDAVHSSIVFRAKHMGVSYFYGRFNAVSGAFAIDENDPKASSFEVEVKADSIDTANDKRDQHLKSPDFFNVKQFPLIKFKSSEVKKTADKTYEVKGDLTLLGETKPLTVQVEHVGTVKDPRGGTKSGFETTFTIKRSDFGMNYGLQGLGDEVRLTVSIEGAKE